MKHLILFLISVISLSNWSFSQNVGISATGVATDNSAGLDVNFTNKGLLIPRVNLTSVTDVTTIPIPATSLLVYNLNPSMTSGSLGYWYWNGVMWIKFRTGMEGTEWALNGNSGTVDGTNFIGTTDDKPFNIRVNNEKAGKIDYTTNGIVAFGYQSLNINTTGARNTAIGYQSLSKNTTGPDNTAIGYGALANSAASYGGNTASGSKSLNTNTTGNYNTANGFGALFSNTSGSNNTATGVYAMYTNSTGVDNTAIGLKTLNSNTTGSQNTAVGFTALFTNTAGGSNTATGFEALYKNTVSNNTATGFQSLRNNTDGTNNTANGYASLISNIGGSGNTATGSGSLEYNNSGIDNTAMGFQALSGNTSGSYNTAGGSYALDLNTTGSYNTVNGYASLEYNTTGSSNTADGFEALNTTTGSSNTAIGDKAGFANTTGSNNTFIGAGSNALSGALTNATAIGYRAVAGASNTLVLGATGADQVSVGVGTTTPNSYLETAGSFATAIITITSNIALDKTHYTVIITGGTPIITLPAAGADNNRRSYRIINQKPEPVTISAYIDFKGLPESSLLHHSKIEVQSNGVNWYRVD